MVLPWKKKHKPIFLASTPIVKTWAETTEIDENFFSILDEWRKNYARVHKLTEEQVLTDGQLRKISIVCPRDNRELEEVELDPLREDLFEEILIAMSDDYRAFLAGEPTVTDFPDFL